MKVEGIGIQVHVSLNPQMIKSSARRHRIKNPLPNFPSCYSRLFIWPKEVLTRCTYPNRKYIHVKRGRRN